MSWSKDVTRLYEAHADLQQAVLSAGVELAHLDEHAGLAMKGLDDLPNWLVIRVEQTAREVREDMPIRAPEAPPVPSD